MFLCSLFYSGQRNIRPHIKFNIDPGTLKRQFSCILLTYQLDDLNENPVISRGGHEFEEEGGQG